MKSNVTLSCLAAAIVLVTIAPASAQLRGPSVPPGSPFGGGVPEGTPSSAPLKLTVADVIRRALDHNLGVLLADSDITRSRGSRWLELSRLLPDVSGSIDQSRQVVNLEAFGFPLRGEFPPLVGPFNVFDARLRVSQAVVDLPALNDTRAEGHQLAASRHSLRNARELVVLVAANLYLQTVAADARAESARAQRDTAQALFTQAGNLRQSGIVAGIDVIRAEVRLATERQRVTAAENDFQKSKLELARVIGLPLGQEYALETVLPSIPVPDITLQAALDRAYRDRADYLAAVERVRAAELRRQGAVTELLPSLHLDADYGAIGLTAGSARSTYRVLGSLNVPIFESGRRQGHLLQSEAELRERRAELDDLRGEIYYDIRTAFLDLQANGERLDVATRARDLAGQQLAQSRDRFAAGVANNIEIIQAQEAVALASEQYISAFYAFNVSKAVLARSLGTAEDAVARYLGGSNP